MSEAERARLQGIVDGPGEGIGHAKPMGPFRLVLNVGAGAWYLSAMAILASWSLIAWLARITMGVEISLHSATGDVVYPLSALAATVIAVLAVAFALAGRRKKPAPPKLIADLEAGRVLEENHEFSAAMRMQEQKYGGLIYFLRATDGRVFVLYDHESQDIGILGQNPLISSFEPRARLSIVRAPQFGWAIDKSFSGAPLAPGEPLDLLAHDWPKDETYIDVSWADLEATYCRPASRRAVPAARQRAGAGRELSE